MTVKCSPGTFERLCRFKTAEKTGHDYQRGEDWQGWTVGLAPEPIFSGMVLLVSFLFKIMSESIAPPALDRDDEGRAAIVII